MKTRKPKGDESVGEQLQAQFAIPTWTWTRLKVVYEAMLVGNEYAAELVRQVDLGSITVSTAYRLLKERQDDDDTVGSISSVRLADLKEKCIHGDAYFRTVAAALRRGVRINKGGMTGEDCEELVRMTRAVSLHMKQVADLLSSSLTEGTKAHGRQS